MIIIFINRKMELAFLEEHFAEKNAELIVIYGRRRVGKTELLLKFANDKPHVYFLASETTERDNLKELFQKLEEFFKDDVLRLEKNWDNLFKYLATKKRFILIIDEFPYLASINKAIPSIFQRSWDLYLKDSQIFLVLSGSSVGMMEEHVLSYRAPLYGRRTGQWKLQPLKFKELFQFFPNYSTEAVIHTYGALDAIPAYLVKFKEEKGFWENLQAQLLSKGAFLYDEADFLLKQELREPKIYKTILKTIAAGNTKFSEILNFSGIEKNKLFVYLDTLESLNIIEKRLPLFEKISSKKGRYYIKDNFFKFWFRYVLPNRSSLEEGNIEAVLAKIKSDYSHYIGQSVFESICMEFLRQSSALPFEPEKISNHWGNITREKKSLSYEIDLVAVNDQSLNILFAECKWQERVNASQLLRQLKEKAELVDWNNGSRKEHFAIFAKSFKHKITEPDLHLYDLRDLEKAFKKR